MRVGIFGGTFNPPHIGHLVCAQEARWQLELDRVLLVPVGDAPHKAVEQDAGREARFELCRLAVEGEAGLEASRLEVDREGPSYTVDTLRSICEDAAQDELFLIMGGDAAKELRDWKEPEAVLRLATLAVAEREGARRDEVVAAVEGLGGDERVTFFSMPAIGVSSTMVRRRVAAGQPIRWLVPPAVASYIEPAELYRQEETD